MARTLSQKEIKKLEEERESRARDNYRHYLMYDWNKWNEVTPLSGRERDLCIHATKGDPLDLGYNGLDNFDITNHLEVCAYRLITNQPIRDYRGYDIFINTSLYIQYALLTVLCSGIYPTDFENDIVLSRGWILFLFFVFICVAFFRKILKLEKRKEVILDAMVTEADLAAYIRTPKCAESMQKNLISKCPYEKEIKVYLNWYEKQGKSEERITWNHRFQYTKNEHERFKRVLKLPHINTIAPELYDVRINRSEFINYAVNKLVSENDISDEESEQRFLSAKEYHQYHDQIEEEWERRRNRMLF